MSFDTMVRGGEGEEGGGRGGGEGGKGEGEKRGKKRQSSRIGSNAAAAPNTQWRVAALGHCATPGAVCLYMCGVWCSPSLHLPQPHPSPPPPNLPAFLYHSLLLGGAEPRARFSYFRALSNKSINNPLKKNKIK